MSLKRGYRKKIKTLLERALLRFFFKLYANSQVQIQKCNENSVFGCDEVGRDIKDGLRHYVRLIRSRRLQVHTLIVLGSRVKATWNPQSDVDVTIIADNLPGEGKNPISMRLFDFRRRILLSDRPLCLGIEPSGCCSRADFLVRLEQFDIQALDAILYGKLIYDDGFWQCAKRKYDNLRKRYGLDGIPLKEMLLLV